MDLRETNSYISLPINSTRVCIHKNIITMYDLATISFALKSLTDLAD